MTSRHHRALPLRVRGDVALSLTTSSPNQTVNPVLIAQQPLTLDWGDGSTPQTVPANTLGPTPHTYASAGTYVLRITEGAESLTTINVQGQPFTFGLRQISGLTKLATLAANFSQLTGQLSNVGNVPALRRMFLAFTQVNGPTQAAGFPAVTQLEANGTDLDGSAGLGVLTNVTSLRLDNCAMTSAQLAALVADLHAARTSFTAPAPSLNIGGSNAIVTPATVVQINDLADNYGWGITYNAPQLDLALNTFVDNQTITPIFNAERALVVDWGDGSGTQTVPPNTTTPLSHTYATKGSYTVTLSDGWPHLRTLDLQSDPFTFDISVLAGLPLLQTLNLIFTGVSGDLAVVGQLPALTDLLSNLSNITGSLGSLANASLLDRVWLINTPVSVAAGLGSLPLLANVDLSNNTLSSTDVDAVIADLFANRTTQTAPLKTLNIAGSNAAPGDDAAAQITILENSFGWSITTS